METAQERELKLQGRQAWPFHAMATSLDASSNHSSGSSSGSGGSGDCFLLGWEPPFGCFGVLAADAGVQDLFPLHMDSLPASPAASTAVTLPLPSQDAAAMPEELDDLLLNFWDTSGYGDVGEQQQVAFNSSCVPQHEKSNSTATTTTTNSFFYDDPLGSIFSTGSTLAGKAVLEATAEPSSAPPPPTATRTRRSVTTVGPGRRPPPPRQVTRGPRPPSLLLVVETRDAGRDGVQPELQQAAEGGVVCPFAVLKPDGLDGGATLADINARILMRPARPVRHPVGEFACAPRVSADKPGLSGKTVSGFTRLHTADAAPLPS